MINWIKSSCKINSINYHPNGKIILSGNDDNSIKIYDL